MTPDQAAMVDFLRQQYADGIDRARSIGNMLITEGASRLGIPAGNAEEQARDDLRAAETRARFFDETVVPYLGTAGPTGRIADIQLRLLADEHRGAPDYREEWRP
ncbi:hypothetical protein [Streptomyces ziwulingensis]|uniref:Uncharacterized protein n=1 Tax=Streptomyces ziwulingensis TaxID=1045501 RepID=A0ABP9D1T4_9ACTN